MSTGVGAAGAAPERPHAGRHAVVTGGGRGMGTAIAEVLARQGAAVTVMGRTRETLEHTAAAIAAAHGGAVGVEVVDLAEPDQIERAFAAAVERLGPVSLLVNNAGIAIPAPFHRTDLALWNKIFAIDATAPFLCSRQVLLSTIRPLYLSKRGKQNSANTPPPNMRAKLLLATCCRPASDWSLIG